MVVLGGKLGRFFQLFVVGNVFLGQNLVVSHHLTQVCVASDLRAQRQNHFGPDRTIHTSIYLLNPPDAFNI